MSAPYTTKVERFNASTTADATTDGHTVDAAKGYILTSSGYQVGDRKKFSLQIASVGTTPVCYVDVSQDNSTWTAYNRIVSNATGAYAGVSYVTGNINTGAMIMFPEGDHFNYFRILAVFSTPMNVSASEVTSPNITATLHSLY